MTSKNREFIVADAWIDDKGFHVKPSKKKVTMIEVDCSEDVCYLSGKTTDTPLKESGASEI